MSTSLTVLTPRDPPLVVATILMVGFPASVIEELGETAPREGRILPVDDQTAAMGALDSRNVRVVCLGPGLAPAGALAIIDRAVQKDAGSRPEILVLGAGGDLEPFQDLVDADRLFYLASRSPGATEIRALLHSALLRRSEQGPRALAPELAVEWLLRLVTTLDEEDDEGRISRLCAQAVQALVDADEGECLLFDRGEETLKGWKPGSSEARRESTAAGLVGWVARTATPARAERVGADPRYEPEADTEGGSAEERFLAVPAATAGDGIGAHPQVRAVLVARRAPQAPPFDDVDQATLMLLGAQVSSVLDRLRLRRRVEGVKGAGRPATADEEPLYREEALARQADDGGGRGRPLALAPGWTRRTYQLLLWLFVASLAILSWGSVHEYAEGVAVVRVAGQIEVHATAAGVIEESPVSPGQTVRKGELLVRLDDAREAAELERIRREFELALVERLRDPTAPGGQGGVGSLREQLRLAEARLEERSLRAPASGEVVERRAEAGQPVAPGQTLMTLVPADPPPDGRPSVVAFFPGRYRPLLGPGMPLLLELEGHRGVRHRARVGEVADAVVGPAEARRILGADVADAVPLTGPVVVVRAFLSSASFESDGRSFRYHDGLTGRAEVRVRSDGLLSTLLPGLKGVFGKTDA